MEGVSGLTNLVMLPTWIFSGVFFSASNFPAVIQPMVQALPLTALVDGMRAIMLQGASLATVGPQLGILALYIVVSLAAALRVFRWQQGAWPCRTFAARRMVFTSDSSPFTMSPIMRHLTAVFGLLCIAALPLAAQATPSLRGTIRDSTGRALPRVEVSYRTVRTLSDGQGNFRLSPVPLGRILVKFARSGQLIGEVEANVTSDTMPDVSVEVVNDPTEPRTLRGTVVDETGKPIADVPVDVVTAVAETRTDTAGRFVVRDLKPQRHIVRVRRVGYQPTYAFADLNDNSSTRLRIVLRQFAGQNLGVVVVRADRVPARLSGFASRAARGSGWGRIITETEILSRSPLRTSDVLQGLAGVRVVRNGYGSGTLLGRGNCRLAVFINGVQVQTRSGSGVDELLNPQDLAGIEIYNGIGGVPSELMTIQSNGCGTVGFWTK